MLLAYVYVILLASLDAKISTWRDSQWQSSDASVCHYACLIFSTFGVPQNATQQQ